MVSGLTTNTVGETCLENVLAHVDNLRPAALVIDSVQTIYSSKFPSAPGSISASHISFSNSGMKRSITASVSSSRAVRSP